MMKEGIQNSVLSLDAIIGSWKPKNNPVWTESVNLLLTFKLLGLQNQHLRLKSLELAFCACLYVVISQSRNYTKDSSFPFISKLPQQPVYLFANNTVSNYLIQSRNNRLLKVACKLTAIFGQKVIISKAYNMVGRRSLRSNQSLYKYFKVALQPSSSAAVITFLSFLLKLL